MLVGVIDAAGRGRSPADRLLARAEPAGASSTLLEAELRERRSTRAPAVGAIGLGIPCTIDRELRALRQRRQPAAPGRAGPRPDRRAHRAAGLVDNDGNTAVIAEQRIGAAAGATQRRPADDRDRDRRRADHRRRALPRQHRRGRRARPRRRRHRRPALSGQLPQSRLHRVDRLGDRARTRGERRGRTTAPGLRAGPRARPRDEAIDARLVTELALGGDRGVDRGDRDDRPAARRRALRPRRTSSIPT